MNLTPEQVALGRRNFLRAIAGLPTVAAAGTAAAQTPPRGAPLRVGFVGVGAQGRSLLGRAAVADVEVRALCDINPASLTRASDVMQRGNRPPAKQYAEWREMLEHEDLEAVILAVPLWAHADVTVGCLNAGKHVLCEKMMAWDVAGCQRMIDAAAKNKRVLEIGYQRNYNGIYLSAYDGVVKAGLLGDIYHARLAWHRNGNWRRAGDPPSKDYSPAKWGYPTFEHLWNWRLYWKYSQGLFCELGSHQVNAANWFLGAKPQSVQACGGIHRFKDGREVPDHVYALFEYPGGVTGTFTSIESNAFDEHYEEFFGTKGTLIIRNENDAMLFEEGAGSRPTGIEIGARNAAAETSETRPAQAGGAAQAIAAPPAGQGQASASTVEIARFVSAIRSGTPLACGPEKAFQSTRWTLAANEALKTKAQVKIS